MLTIKTLQIPLCNRCIKFVHVPFTVGKCRRRFLNETQTYPSIVDERDNQHCGRNAKFFSAREKAA